MVDKEIIEKCTVARVNVPGPGKSTKCPRALGTGYSMAKWQPTCYKMNSNRTRSKQHS